MFSMPICRAVPSRPRGDWVGDRGGGGGLNDLIV